MQAARFGQQASFSLLRLAFPYPAIHEVPAFSLSLPRVTRDLTPQMHQ
jgi:hypothetical protein